MTKRRHRALFRGRLRATAVAVFSVGWSTGAVACGHPPPYPDNPYHWLKPPPTADEIAADVIVRIGSAMEDWEDSCRVPGTHGLCVELVPVAPSPLHCGGPRLGEVVAHPRESWLADRALAELGDALESATVRFQEGCLSDEYPIAPDDPQRRHELQRAMTTAYLAQLEGELVTYMAMGVLDEDDLETFITDHTEREGDPSPRKSSAAWWSMDLRSYPYARAYELKYRTAERMVQSLDYMVESLERMGSSLDEEARQRVDLRTAWIWANLSDAMYGPEIVELAIGNDELTNAYCEYVHDMSDSARREALRATHRCAPPTSPTSSATVEACEELERWLLAPDRPVPTSSSPDGPAPQG